MTSTPMAGRVGRRAAAVVAVLLVAAAGLLIVGILLERHAETRAGHPMVAATGEQQEGHHGESTEGGHPQTAVPENDGGEAADQLTGMSVESPGVVVLAAVASIALAFAVWLRPNRAVIAIVLAFTVAALVLDVLELSHQLGADRIGLAALAGVIVALRVATIIGGGYLYRSRPVAP